MFDEKGLKNEMEALLKYSSTKDELIVCRGMCHGMIYGVANFWCKYGFETPESVNLADWWRAEMLPKINKKIEEMG